MLQQLDVREVRACQQNEAILIGRITSQYRDMYHLLTDKGEAEGRVSGKFNYTVDAKEDYPVVGDFVRCKLAHKGEVIIENILPRKSMICRKVAGAKSDMQVLATNIDKVFIAMSLNNDFNIRRLERYMMIAWESGATPVVVLTKADLCQDIDSKIKEVELIAVGVEVIAVSVMEELGIEAIRNCIEEEETVVFIGSSGVGKSSLVNKLLGMDIQEVKTIDEHDKGRHTTTHRELFQLPSGGMIIDTPGMRELQFNQGDLESTFSDIEALSRDCYFTDCKHQTEPRCAIKLAIEKGELSRERYDSYVKLGRELRLLEARKKHKEKINMKKHSKKKATSRK